MDPAFFRDGASLAMLRERLGEPLPSGSGLEPDINVETFAVVSDHERRLDELSGTIVVWDCIGYEASFHEIRRAIARAPENAQVFSIATLAVASQLHVLSQCSARRVGEDRWILERQCVKHLWKAFGE